MPDLGNLTSLMGKLHGLQPIFVQGSNLVYKVLCHAGTSTLTHQLLISYKCWHQKCSLSLHDMTAVSLPERGM